MVIMILCGVVDGKLQIILLLYFCMLSIQATASEEEEIKQPTIFCELNCDAVSNIICMPSLCSAHERYR